MYLKLHHGYRRNAKIKHGQRRCSSKINVEDMGTCASEDVVEADDDMDHIAWMRKPIGQNCPWHKDISRLTVENVEMPRP